MPACSGADASAQPFDDEKARRDAPAVRKGLEMATARVVATAESAGLLSVFDLSRFRPGACSYERARVGHYPRLPHVARGGS